MVRFLNRTSKNPKNRSSSETWSLVSNKSFVFLLEQTIFSWNGTILETNKQKTKSFQKQTFFGAHYRTWTDNHNGCDFKSQAYTNFAKRALVVVNSYFLMVY